MLVNATSAQSSINDLQGAFNVIMTLGLAVSDLPKQTCIFNDEVFDYIIVGGGTAGCVLAKRLVEDKKTSVLLIEAGADPPIQSNIPALLLFLKSSHISWNFTVEDFGPSRQSQKPTNDDMSLGKVLGGSSAVSYLTYSPGSKHDYDHWAKQVNSSIWNWENVLPYLKKSQRLEDSELSETDGDYFGEDGNIGLTVLRNAGNISSVPYFKIFKELGYEIIPSLNGNRSIGYTSPIFTTSNNIQQNTAISYLNSLDKSLKLRVLKNSIVVKVLFDAKKNAIGVKVYTYDNRYIYIRTKKEVIISAGVVNTPKLLMLSGIGPRKHLHKHKIHTISDLPVGKGLQDHLAVTLYFNMTKLFTSVRPFDPYQFPVTVILGHIALNKSDDYPDYEAINYINYPINCFKYCTFTYSYNDTICNNLIETSTNTENMYTIIKKQKFKSRGRVLLRSNNFMDSPLIYSGHYAVKEDLDDFARILQNFMKVEQTEAFKMLGGQFKDPKLNACKKYDKKQFEYWKCYVKYLTASQHQYAGTCPMGKVVDPYLRVYGVKGLRIVDASVMPNPPAGGTLGATIMIGEKAADLIINKKHNSE